MSNDRTKWQEVVAEDKQPDWDGAVPFCSGRACEQYDGNRCRLAGFQPRSICEPAVTQMGEMLTKQEKGNE